MKALSIIVLLSASVSAQQLHVVPQAMADVSGNAATWLPGCGGGGATQVLISATHLRPLVGHTIVGLEFRRDGTWLPALPQSDATLVVRIGASARGPRSGRCIEYRPVSPRAHARKPRAARRSGRTTVRFRTRVPSPR